MFHLKTQLPLNVSPTSKILNAAKIFGFLLKESLRKLGTNLEVRPLAAPARCRER
jgi:hypothetical protein